MKKSLLRAGALVLAVAMLAVLLTGCTNSKVNKLMDKFETACTELDAETMLDCLDPSISKPIKSILNLFGADDVNGIAEEIFKVLDIIDFEGQSPSEVLATLKIKPEAHVYNEAKDECKVTAVLSYTIGEETKSHTVVFDCVLDGEEWYIHGADF